MQLAKFHKNSAIVYIYRNTISAAIQEPHYFMNNHNDSTYKEQIVNWLKIAFTQVGKQPSEDFFYDKRDNQFFSTLLLDYLMFEDDFSLAPGVTTSFTDEKILQLSDRLKRIYSSSTDILPIPKVSKSYMTNLNPDDEKNIAIEIEDFLSAITYHWKMFPSGKLEVRPVLKLK